MEGSILSQELHPISKKRLYEQVASRVETLILTEMHPGDRLPTERELARVLGVSRCSLRDALLRLKMLGIIDTRPRSGTVVRKVNAGTLVPPVAGAIAQNRPPIVELLDFCKMVEPSIAARAARNASREDIVELEAILVRQASKTRDGEAAVEEESQFHCAVAKAAHNGILPKVVGVVMSLLREARASSVQSKALSRRCVSAHRQIITAIKRHDPKAAAQAMSRNIANLEKRVSPQRRALKAA